MNSDNHHHHRALQDALQKTVRALIAAVAMLLLLVAGVLIYIAGNWKEKNLFVSFKKENTAPSVSVTPSSKPDYWQAPEMNDAVGEEVKYGRELIAQTALYLGPKGTVAQLSNGMNCQNCHLDAGTRAWGNNYSAVASTYPKFRARSGTNETIIKRVSDCFERSLNGTAPDSNSKEMKAIVAYINWLGSEVPKGETPKGAGLIEVPFLDRAADPLKGKEVFSVKCVSCHGTNGEGQLNNDQTAYTYPPLWGKHSYNSGAGLYRLSRFAGYVKANMPLGATAENPQLTDEEAWDLAAYVNSQVRPAKDLSDDWPEVSKKPVDHPFGPYADKFSEQQHKFGPFGPIKKAADDLKKKKQQKS